MAQRFSPPEEIAESQYLSIRDLERAIRHHCKTTPAKYFAALNAQGRFMIRQAQFDLAVGNPPAKGQKEPNANMLRWMGMQHLAQTPKYHTLNKRDNEPAEVEKEKPDGFEFTTPDGVTVISHTGTAPGLPAPQPKKQPHEEPAIVEEILKAELAEAVLSTEGEQVGTRRVIVVSGHSENQ